MKRLLAACAALMIGIATQASGQSAYDLMVKPDTVIPLVSEFGPRAWVDDGLNYDDLVFTGLQVPATGSGAPDVVGAFRFVCESANVLTDDSIVYPGQPGRSHIHNNYGNTLGNANSTYASLRTTGESTCINRLNRSHYWIPALLDGLPSDPTTKVVLADNVAVYYKRFPKNSAECTPGNDAFRGRCVAIPHDLKFIFGTDMVTHTVPTGSLYFQCIGANGETTGRKYATVSQAAVEDGNCVPGGQLLFKIQAPSCWDGKNLDSPNHRSHTANFLYQSGINKSACPLTHPYIIPAFELTSVYTLDNRLNLTTPWFKGQATYYFASDVMPGMEPSEPGSTVHADFRDGWNQRAKKVWTDNCIDRLLSCAAGVLGDGSIMKTEWPLDYKAIPRTVKRPKMNNEASISLIRGPH